MQVASAPPLQQAFTGALSWLGSSGRAAAAVALLAQSTESCSRCKSAFRLCLRPHYCKRSLELSGSCFMFTCRLRLRPLYSKRSPELSAGLAAAAALLLQ
jgi:hypothetical protein